MRLRSAPLLALTFVLAALLPAGCDSGDALRSEDTFGDPYRIVTRLPDPSTPDLDVSPRIQGNALQVAVQYGGGCQQHDFTVRFRRSAASAEVWLVHDAHNDLCEALITDRLVLPLPTALLDEPSLVLRAPDGQRFTLR